MRILPRRQTFLAIAVFLIVANFAISEDSRKRLFDRRYAAHLPEYCLYTQGLPDGSAGMYDHPLSTGKYRTMFGDTWHHLHHYCFGLDDLFNAANHEDPFLRQGSYRKSVGEFDYVLHHAPDDFILGAEIYVNKAFALQAMKQYGDAVEAYTAAIERKSDYVPAYIGLSSCFETLGDVGQALAIIESGLQQAPDSSALRERHSQLLTRAAGRFSQD